MSYQIQLSEIATFSTMLVENESSPRTIEKYIRDAKAFYQWLPKSKEVTKELVVTYKYEIMKKYAVSSVNSMLAAINCFLQFLGLGSCTVKSVKSQRQIFCKKERELTREEYFRLLKVASSRGEQRLNLIMQTICSTGIRIGELEHITVEAVRMGRAEVNGKGKRRTVLLPKTLSDRLNRYLRERHITSGSVFVTKTGKPMNRGNIWSAMKKLCESANVAASKVFPHNLRHLFARLFYGLEKDIVRLADILGHSNIDTTRIYMTSTGREHIKKIERLGLVV